MPAQPLSDEQKQDARRLKSAWDSYKLLHPEATQEKLAADCGWKTQGAVSQYLLGRIPLNLSALLKFSSALKTAPESISPSLATPLREEAMLNAQLAAQQSREAPSDVARQALTARLATADPATVQLVELALYENDPQALQNLSPSLVAMVRGLKAAIAAQSGKG